MYYSKMIERLELADVEWTQIKTKMKYLRTKFIEVKKWLDGTGQGVDAGTIEDYKRLKCPHYDFLHVIFGTRANVVIPYQYDSLASGDQTGNKTGQCDVSSQENMFRGNDGTSEQPENQNNEVEPIERPLDATMECTGTESIDLSLFELADGIIDMDDFFTQPNDVVLDENEVDNSSETIATRSDSVLVEESHQNDADNAPITSRDVIQRDDSIQRESQQNDERNVSNGEGNRIMGTQNGSSSQGIRPPIQRKRPASSGPTEEEYSFSLFCHDPREAENEQEDSSESCDSRLARFKKQLS